MITCCVREKIDHQETMTQPPQIKQMQHDRTVQTAFGRHTLKCINTLRLLQTVTSMQAGKPVPRLPLLKWQQEHTSRTYMPGKLKTHVLISEFLTRLQALSLMKRSNYRQVRAV